MQAIAQVISEKIISFSGRKKEKPVRADLKDLPGQIQYFYSDPDSFLPVRDVCNKQGAGFKTEPHIENGSENFIKECAQHNIKGALNRGAEYLFLVTKCVNKQLRDFFGKQYIVGYIKIKEGLERENKEGKAFTCAKGEVKIVSYEDAIPVKDRFGFHFSRSLISSHGKLDKKRTGELVEELKDKKDITKECIDEIIQLDKANMSCTGKSCSSCKGCYRWQKMQGSKGIDLAA